LACINTVTIAVTAITSVIIILAVFVVVVFRGIGEAASVPGEGLRQATQDLLMDM